MLGGLGEDLFAVERRSYLVGSEGVGDPRGMGGGFEIAGLHCLHVGSVFEDHSQLLAVCLEIGFAQCQSGQARNMGDVDVDGHRVRLVATRYPPRIVTPSTRSTLGLAAALLMAAGTGVVVWGPDPLPGEVLIRAGVLVGALWLVGPLIRRPGLATLGALAAGVAVVARPRLLIPIVVAAVLWWLARRGRSEGIEGRHDR